MVDTPDSVVGAAAASLDTPEDLAGLVGLLAAAILVDRAVSPAPAAEWAFRTAILDSRTTSLIDLSFMTDFAAAVLGIADSGIAVSRLLDFETIALGGVADEGGARGMVIRGGDRPITIRGGGTKMTVDSTRIITGSTKSRMR